MNVPYLSRRGKSPTVKKSTESVTRLPFLAKKLYTWVELSLVLKKTQGLTLSYNKHLLFLFWSVLYPFSHIIQAFRCRAWIPKLSEISPVGPPVFATSMDNLKYYLRECTLPDLSTDGNLPELPLIGHKSHKNHLAVRPETWRRLETVCPLADTIDHTVASCTKVDIFINLR